MSTQRVTEVCTGGVYLRINITDESVLLSAYFPEEAGEPSWAGCTDLIVPQAANLCGAMDWYSRTHTIEHLAYLVIRLHECGKKSENGKVLHVQLIHHLCKIMSDYFLSPEYAETITPQPQLT
jgi:hypothetical protein